MLRMLFDWLILGHVPGINPAAAAGGHKHVVKKSKTLVCCHSLRATGITDHLISGGRSTRRSRWPGM
jgi:hypothetical protein